MSGHDGSAVDAERTDRVIGAGISTDAALVALIDELGLDTINEILVDEIVFRCPAPENTTAVNIAMDVTHAGRRCRTVFRMIRDAPVDRVDVDESAIHVWLEITVADLLRRLFGPVGRWRTGYFHNALLPSGTIHLQHLGAAARATNTLLSAWDNTAVDLGSLAVRYGSDKWASLHWYTPHYERHFARYQGDPVRVLEIGIGGEDRELGGASLKMWKRYFHRGLIFGVDIVDKSALNQRRLTAVVGDQRVPDELTAIGRRHGPFDVIIDDGSHVAQDTRTCFHALLPHLRDGGTYVIEDLQTSYLAEFGGGNDDVAAPHTAVGLVRQLVDDLHFRERARSAEQPPTRTQATIIGIHVYHNIVFLEKGTNGEEGFPSWLRELLTDPDRR